MDSKTITRPLITFVKRLRQDCSVDQVILFGSSANGSRQTDSDVDVIVVSKDFRRLNEDRRLDLLYKHSLFLKPEIHPWGVTPEELSAASRLTTLGHARDHGRPLL